MRTTTGSTRRAPKQLRPIQVCENYEVVAELDAFNLRDALNRFARSRPWLTDSQIAGNVLTVDDDGEQRSFYSRDPVGTDYLSQVRS